MKWAVRSILGLVIGGCAALAVLAGHWSGVFLSGASPGPSANGRNHAADPPGSAGTADPLLAALHVENRRQHEKIVAQIRDEFGIEADPDQFSSHHTARDYLERLRLARQAKRLGFDVDPDAFGDDEFMRRHIEALRQGLASAAPTAAPVGVAPEKLATADPGGAASEPAPPDRGDYIFIYGHRYYPDGQGAYIRADGTVLGLSTARRVPAGADAPTADRPIDAPIPGMDLLGELDKVLELLGARTSENG